MWLLRLGATLGLTLGEVRQLVTPAELALWVALSEDDGPWWYARGDYHAAAVRQAAIAAAGGKPGPLVDQLIVWGGSAEPSAHLLPYADGLSALAAMMGRSGR